LDNQVDTEILENLAQHLIFTQKAILFGLDQQHGSMEVADALILTMLDVAVLVEQIFGPK
jgi:hypothetical protein